MKRNLQFSAFLSALLMVMAMCSIAPAVSCAASPSDIKLKYDLNKRLLLVTIVRDTAQDRSDFVRFVEIKKNGTVVSIHTYDSQPEGKALTYYYRINAIEEDTLQVVVTYNKSGSSTSPMLIVAP